MSDYIQMSFISFVNAYPARALILAERCPFFLDMLRDKNYIVRLKGDKIEIGYTWNAWSISDDSIS